jgi:hypothetical protein
MLRELLALIASGHSGTGESIARELGLRAPEVDDMLARLQSLGYIEDFASSCASCCADDVGEKRGHCASCALCAVGMFASRAHVWILSPKGREALKAERDLAQARP